MNLYANDKKTGTEEKRFLEFNLGTESYAVELLLVKEVITPPEMTPIPKAPPYVCGLINLRGLVLTVIDLRKKLGILPHKDTSQTGVIIFDFHDRSIGVVVDSIQKVLTLEPEHIRTVSKGELESNAPLLGILQHESRLSMWIDPGALLDKVS